MWKTRLTRCLALLPLIVSAKLDAEPRAWDGGAGAGDTRWETAANWNPNGVPTRTSEVTLGTGVPAGLRIDADDRSCDFFGTCTTTLMEANTLTIGTINPFTVDGSLVISNPFGSNEVIYTRLTLNSGDVTRQDVAGVEGDHLIDADMRLAADGLWNIAGSGKLIATSISESGGSRAFTKVGNGTLQANLNVSGAKTISQGTFEGSIHGAGTATFEDGTVFRASDTSDSNIVLTGSGGSLLFAALQVQGGAALQGQITLANNLGISVDGFLSLEGGITDIGLSRGFLVSGGGELRLSGPGSFSGNVSMFSEGKLTIGNNSALGTGLVAINDSSAGNTANPTIAFEDGITFANPINLRGARLSVGDIFANAKHATVTSNISLQGLFAPETNFLNVDAPGDSLTISGNISEAIAGSSVRKTGAGKVILSGTNTFTGGLTVEAGVLVASASSSLPTGPATVVQSGGRIDLQGNQTFQRALQMQGNGAGGLGALRSAAGNNVWAGAVTLGGNSSLGAAAQSQLTISGPITGAFELTKVDPGTLRLTHASNTFTSLTIAEGLLALASPVGIPAAAPISVSPGASVTLQSGAVINRKLILNGIGSATNVGAFDNEVGDNRWSGEIVLQSNSTLSTRGGSLNVSGNIQGAFELTKVGSGTLMLTGSNSHGNTVIEQGRLLVRSNGALPAGTIASVATGATLQIDAGVTTNAAARTQLNGQGINGLGALSVSQGVGVFAGNVTLETPTSIGAPLNATLTIRGQIDDLTPLPLVKTDQGTLILAAANTYRGDTFIERGTLVINSDAALGQTGSQIHVNNGSKLVVAANTSTNRTMHLNTGSIQVDANMVLTYNNATVSGGFLRGPGTHALVGSSTSLSGTTALPGSKILQSSAVTLNNFSNAGALTNSAPLVWSGGFNLGAGSVTVNSTLFTEAFENDGLVTIPSGGTLSNSGNDLASSGGSRLIVQSGGAVQLHGTSLNLYGALAVNDGTIDGTTNVHYGSLLEGTGVFGAVQVFDGGTFSPGASPGNVSLASATWNAGGRYRFELRDAAGVPGIDSDLMSLSGPLNFACDNTFNAQCVIELASLNADNQSGLALNFDPTRPISFLLATTEASITGFSAEDFRVDTSRFQNSLQ